MASPSDGEAASALPDLRACSQFFSHFVFAPYIEIVETPRPKLLLLLPGSRKLLPHLGRKIFLEHSRNLLFENLQNSRGIAHPGFADQNRHKWLELAPWHNKQDGATEKGNGSGKANSAGTSNAKSEKVNRAPELAPPPEKIHAEPAGKGIPSFQVELLPMEDIYRVNGVMNPRKGYSINKVVEMLRNQHVRGLSREMKRVAVLMALDFYEVEQKKQFEAEWARKVEENRQIRAELELVIASLSQAHNAR